jgi:hypothetical protein
MSQVNLITISLSPPHPENGMAATVVRLHGQDKFNFDLAAQHMGMPRSTLMRVLLVRGAERILQELGVTAEYEQNKYIDLSKGESLISGDGD